MKPSTWRAIVLATCAVCAMFSIAAILGTTGAGGAKPWYGLWGATFTTASQPYHMGVLSVDPGGASDRAGLRQGDAIDIGANSLFERFGMFNQPLNARPVVLSVQRGSHAERIAVVPEAIDARRWDIWVQPIGVLWLILLTALIAWRRPYAPGNLVLATLLATMAIGFQNPSIFPTPWTWMYVLLAVMSLANILAIGIWAAYAGFFAQPLSTTRLWVRRCTYAFVAIAIAAGIVELAGVVTLRIDPVRLAYSPLWQIPFWGAILMAIASSVLAIAAASGVERQRALWSLIPLVAYYCVYATYDFANISLTSYAAGQYVLGALNNLSTFLVPLALTYAALSRRLIDVGFVLNRAAVFAIVSSIVIGTFILVEWAASEWLAGTTHTTSAVIGMVVALGLGLSMRFIHHYVDRFVDRVFFRKRHDDEAALRRFAHESAYITDRDVLLERALRTVREHTDADAAEILVRDGPATYVSGANGERKTVGENDPGIVALRAWSKPVDLARLPDSAIRGEFAFPMISRGSLVGALVCGPKRDGEAYAPDESDALLALAHGVGTALDTLSLRGDAGAASLQETLVRLLEGQEVLLQRLNGKSPPSVPE